MSFEALLASADEVARRTLGGDVIYTPGAGAAVTVRGVYDAAYVKVDVGHAGVSSSGPAVFLRLSELPSNPSDDAAAKVTRAGVDYKVRESEPDGQGGVLLLLQRA